MADLKLSQLPITETLANTDLLPIKTTAGTKTITFEDLKGSQEGYFKRVIDEYMEFDYEDLTAMRTYGKLIAGQKYLLTDYQTVYYQSRPGQTPDYADNVSAFEPLVLTAISTDKFSSIAYSPTFPQDVIWYNFDNELSPDNTTVFYSYLDRISKGFKGIIIRRIDTQKNIDYSYDWRTMKWWREGKEVLTFAGLNSAYNIVSGSNCYGNVFGSGCFSNTLGSGCSNNTFGGICFGNTFGNYCHNNTLGSGCSNNTLSSGCYDNTFGSNLQCADVKSGFSNATVTNTAIYNKNYNHTFYIDSANNKKCYCITGGAIVDVPLTEV